LLVILAVFFYFQCAPTSKSITATNVQLDTKLVVTDSNNTTYEVKGTDLAS
jgi:hypothetical protein